MIEACKLESSGADAITAKSDLRCRTCNSAPFASRADLRAHALEHAARFEGVTVTPTDKETTNPATFDVEHLVGDEEDDDEEEEEEDESDREEMVVEPHFLTKNGK